MHITLVDPGTSRHEINEPIGIGALASALAGHLGPTAIIEQFFEPFTGLPSNDVLARTSILGISTPLGSLSRVDDIAVQWREIPAHSRPLLVLGGLTATFAHDALLNLFPEAVLVVGEGEEALPLLADVIGHTPADGWRQALTQHSIPNLVFRAGDQCIRTQRRNIRMEDALAPQRPFLTELVVRGGIARAEASRGCSYGLCTFCAIQEKYCNEVRWRPIGIRRILDELTHLSHVGARHPYFTDEDFVGDDPERAVALAHAIEIEKKKGNIAPDMTLYLDMRVISVLAKGKNGRPSGLEMLSALKEAGLREVFVGIESGAGKQAQRYRKPGTTQRNLRALDVLRGLGLDVDVGFIFFDPEMCLAEAAENLAFLRRAGLWHHDARLTKEIRLEAGTPLVGSYREKDLIAGPMDTDDLTFPYRWIDSRVEAIHVTFRAWEDEEIERVYEIQSAVRGEVVTETERQRRRAHLGQVRAVELDALQALVEAALQGEDPARCCLAAYSGRRSNLLSAYSSRRSQKSVIHSES